MGRYFLPEHDSVDFDLQEYTVPDQDSIDFDIDHAFERRPSTHTAPVQTDSDSSFTLGRWGETYTATVQTDAQETRGRTAETYTAVVETGATRAGMSKDRAGETFLATILTDVLGGPPYWTIDGLQVREMTAEVWQWDSLRLTFRSTRSMVEDRLRPLDDSSGKYEAVEKEDGSYRVVDRATGGNVVTVRGPYGRTDIRPSTEAAVDSYNETIQDQSAEIYEVVVEVTPTSPKDSIGDGGTVTADSDEWHFAFADGEIATGRVDQEMKRGRSTVEGAREISLVLDSEETRILESSLNRQASVRVQEVPDGEDRVFDKSAEGRQTVTVTAPSDDTEEVFLPTGDYVVEEYETVLSNEEFYRVNLSLTEKS